MIDFDLPTRSDLLRLTPPSSPAEHVTWKKQNRKSQILNLLRLHGPLSRVEIASRLGFYFQRASSFVDELLAEGLAVEAGRPRPAAAGRPPTPVALNARAACVLGVEIGRSAVRVLLVDLGGQTLERSERAFSPSADAQSCAAQIEQYTLETLCCHPEALPPLAGVGIASMGHFYESEGAWHCVKPVTEAVMQRLQERFGVPVLHESDTCMLALGELWFGQDKRRQTFVTLNVGDGLGAGLIIGRQYFHGAFDTACDLGHVRLGGSGVACYCGGVSCLETLFSGSAIRRMAIEAGIVSDPRAATVGEVAELARQGNKQARLIFERFADAAAQAIGLVVTLFSPEAVVLSGSVVRHADLFYDRILQQVQTEAYFEYLEHSPIEVSSLCEDAISLGTCARVLHQIFCPSESY